VVAEAANTSVAVLRGTTTTPYGDVVDATTPVYTNLPAVLVETKQDVFDPNTMMPRTVRNIELRVPSWVGLLNSDRIQDLSTGNVYAVIEVETPPTLMGAPVDTAASLKRITATGT